MPLTSSQILALLKQNLSNDASLSDSDLITYLQLGQERIIRDSPETLGSKEASLAITSTARTYSLASDFYQFRTKPWVASLSRAIEYKAPARFIEEFETYATIPSGDPDWFTIVGYDETAGLQQIRLDKTPSDSLTVGYWYNWMPPAITNATSTSTPAISKVGFGELLLWAGTMIARQRNDPKGFGEAVGFYDKLMYGFKSYNAARPVDDAVVDALDAVDGTPRSRLGPGFPE